MGGVHGSGRREEGPVRPRLAARRGLRLLVAAQLGLCRDVVFLVVVGEAVVVVVVCLDEVEVVWASTVAANKETSANCILLS